MNTLEAVAAVDHLLARIETDAPDDHVLDQSAARLFDELAGFSAQTYFQETLADTRESFAGWLHPERNRLFGDDPKALKLIVRNDLQQLRFAISFGDSILELDDNTFTIVPPTFHRPAAADSSLHLEQGAIR